MVPSPVRALDGWEIKFPFAVCVKFKSNEGGVKVLGRAQMTREGRSSAAVDSEEKEERQTKGAR